jgi:hypothetical protein
MRFVQERTELPKKRANSSRSLLIPIIMKSQREVGSENLFLLHFNCFISHIDKEVGVAVCQFYGSAREMRVVCIRSRRIISLWNEIAIKMANDDHLMYVCSLCLSTRLGLGDTQTGHLSQQNYVNL